jgi:mevalonate pyrophosphate decarboxylase
VEEGGSVFEAMKAQEEVKAFYTSWVAEVVAKVQLYSTLLRRRTVLHVAQLTTCPG